MKLLIINGPNLNLLGKREPGIYGVQSFDEYFGQLRAEMAPHGVELDYFQSNVEGEIINAIHQADGRYDGVVLNAGGYTHTSVAIADAIGAVGVGVVEVHISNVMAREEFRHISMIAPKCRGTVTGFGLLSYRLGIESFILK